MRLKLTIEYDGTGSVAGRASRETRTVEGELRRAARTSSTAGARVSRSRGGRTRAFTRSRTSSPWTSTGGPPAERAAEALNAALPEDVAVVRSRSRSRTTFHARFDARSRARIATACGAAANGRRSRLAARCGGRGRSTSQPQTRARRRSLGEHDFRAFTPTETRHEAFVRTVKQARWVELDERRRRVRDHRRLVPAPHGADTGRDDARGPRPRAAARGAAAQRGGRDRSAARPVSHARVLLRLIPAPPGQRMCA